MTITVTISGGLGYTFSNSIEEIAKSVSEGSADQEYLDKVTGKMAVLNAVAATASVTWKPGDKTPGALFSISAELDASLLPTGSDADPNDASKCDAVCAYLRRLLGATGKVSLLGQVDTRDAKVVKFKLDGKILNAVIPLTAAGAELEDFGLLFKLEIPKKTKTTARRRRARQPPSFLLEGDNRATATAAANTAAAAAAAAPMKNASHDHNNLQHVAASDGGAGMLRRQSRGGGSSTCAIDLMILLDASGSIKSECTEKLPGTNTKDLFGCWNKLKEFLRDLIAGLNVGTGATDARVGLVVFNMHAVKVFSLSRYSTNEDIDRVLNKLGDERLRISSSRSDTMRLPGSATYTQKGMRLVRTLIKESNAMAKASTNGRTQPKRLVLVLTDGAWTGKYANSAPCWRKVGGSYGWQCGTSRLHTNNPARVAKEIVEDDGVPIYAVGINLKSERRTVANPDGVRPLGLLHDLAGGSKTLVKDVGNWGELDNVKDALLVEICDPNIHPSVTTTATTPATTATTTTTTTTAPGSATKKCAKPVDIVFVMDVSSSIQDLCLQNPNMKCWPNCTGYQSCWPAMRDFVDETQEHFDVGTGTLQSRVSVVTFGAQAKLKFDFNQHSNNQAVSTAVQALAYSRCLTFNSDGSDKITTGKWCVDRVDTHTSLAFDAVKDNVLVSAAGVRPAAAGVTRVVVTITDGYPTIIEDSSGNVVTSYEANAEAAALRTAGVVTIGVGVRQNDEGYNQLKKMVGNDDRMMVSITDFASLSHKVKELANLICLESGGDDIMSVESVSTSGQDAYPGDPGVQGSGAAITGETGDGMPAGTDTCLGKEDGYKWSLELTATLKCAPKAFSAEASQLTIKSDGSGVLLPGDADELAIDAATVSKVTNDALRLKGALGFYVEGKSIQCLQNMKGRLMFGLADKEALMNILGTDVAHLVNFNVEVLFQGSFPFITEVNGRGGIMLGQYGRAAKCHLMDTFADCSNILELSADFRYKRDAAYGAKKDKIAFLFDLNLRLANAGGQTAGSFALLDLYNAVSDTPMSTKQRQWLALLSSVDYGLALSVVKIKGESGVETFSITLAGTLKGSNLPPMNQADDLVDGNCNVVCQYLHKIMTGPDAKLSLSGTLAIKGKAVSVLLKAEMAGVEIVLGTSPDMTLKKLGFEVKIASKPTAFNIQIKADIDVNDNLKLRGGVGFGIVPARRRRLDLLLPADYYDHEGQEVQVYDPHIAHRHRSRRAITAKFNFGLRAPYYSAFKKDRVHITAFMFNLGLAGTTFPFLSTIEAEGELCLGKESTCKACFEASVPPGGFRTAVPECKGPLYIDIVIKIRVPGQADVSSGGEELASDASCSTSSDGGGWEFFIQATIEPSGGIGALSRLQGAISDGDGSSAVDDKLGVVSACQFIVSLTVGPSRFKITAEARLLKDALPSDTDASGNTYPADSKICGMVCQLCHKLLNKAAAGSYLFIRGEIGMTFKPFSLEVAISAGFGGRIEFDDFTLLRAGVKISFKMGSSALEFEAKLYGAIEKAQAQSFGPNDGVVMASSGGATLKDPNTDKVYGSLTKTELSRFNNPLILDGAFSVFASQGTVGQCGASQPGTPKFGLGIAFGMQGWAMKKSKYVHIGNPAFALKVTVQPPYFDSFSGQAEVCFGSMGRCAKCLLGSNANDCTRTIYAAVYLGLGLGKFYIRTELYSKVSLKGILETFDLDRKMKNGLPDGLNVIEFGPRPGQRAAVFSLATKKQVLSRGYNIKTGTYDSTPLVINAGFELDGRVTLFPDLPALRFTADIHMIIGKQRFLIDFTMSPIQWGCDSSGTGCIFELTGYHHTPSKPQGPRFYVNVVFKKPMEGGVEMTSEEQFGATGKTPVTRRRRANDYGGGDGGDDDAQSAATATTAALHNCMAGAVYHPEMNRCVCPSQMLTDYSHDCYRNDQRFCCSLPIIATANARVDADTDINGTDAAESDGTDSATQSVGTGIYLHEGTCDRYVHDQSAPNACVYYAAHPLVCVPPHFLSRSGTRAHSLPPFSPAFFFSYNTFIDI